MSREGGGLGTPLSRIASARSRSAHTNALPSPAATRTYSGVWCATRAVLCAPASALATCSSYLPTCLSSGDCLLKEWKLPTGYNKRCDEKAARSGGDPGRRTGGGGPF